jgi:hypothetical protein
MEDEREELVRIDSTGAAHPVGRVASQRLRARQGAFRLMPAPSHLVIMRLVGEDGRRDDEDGPIFRLAGEIPTPGALCDVVGLVGQAGWAGELVVLDGNTSRSVFFEHGHVICAQSSATGERLGEVLYRYGALTEEQVEATAAAVTSELRFGEAAVRLGFLTNERLFHLMSKQAEEIVYAVLLVGDGMFYFLDSYDGSRLHCRINLSVNGLLMEGVRRMDETKYFRERIPSELHVPERLASRSPPEPELQKLYDAVDGHRSVADICRVVGQGEFEVTQGLFQLVQSGKVIVHAPRPTGTAAIVALFNQAITVIFGEMDRVQHGDEVREQLASFATGAGIYDQLLQGAGPAADGTVDIDRVVQNAAVLIGPEQGEAMLAQWLYEYVSFALFVAEPLLRQGDAPVSRATPEQRDLSRRVAELIAPLAPS